MKTMTVLMTMVFLSGCYSGDEKHTLWFRDHSTAERLVGFGFTDMQATKLLGQPDYIVRPETFFAGMKGDAVYRQQVIDDLWQVYWWNPVDGRQGRPTIQWTESPDFLGTALWLYDESMHFKDPLCSGPVEEWMCGKSNFVCQIYVVRRGEVIAWFPATKWKGFIDKPDSN